MKLKHQPRIKGIRRIPKHSSIHPLIWHGLKEISKDDKRSISYIIAEIVGDYFGIDAATGHVDRRKFKMVK